MLRHKLIAAGACVTAFALGVAAATSRNPSVFVNGQRLSDTAYNIDDRVYIPLRAVAESMGAEVSWSDSEYAAFIEMTEDDRITKVVEQVSPSVVALAGSYNGSSTATVHGSGVVIKPNGTILTNAHVVESMENITVVLYDGQTLAGRVLYSDKTADLAVVKIEKLGMKPISFAKADGISTGQTAIAIGTPISLTMRNSATKGIVSGKDVAVSGQHYKYLQTDASINSGNSGGPLVNTRGELIGINTRGFAAYYAENVGFAIPVDTVEYALGQFEKNGRIIRPELDMTLEQPWAATIGLPTTEGLTVRSSNDASITVGDIVTHIGGIEVHSMQDVNEALKKTYAGGGTVNVRYLHGGEAAEADAAVKEK